MPNYITDLEKDAVVIANKNSSVVSAKNLETSGVSNIFQVYFDDSFQIIFGDNDVISIMISMKVSEELNKQENFIANKSDFYASMNQTFADNLSNSASAPLPTEKIIDLNNLKYLLIYKSLLHLH